jgi:hypothetical protein
MASIVLASLATLNTISITKIGSAAVSNGDLPYPSNKNAIQEVRIGDIQIDYNVFGKGEPIVLIHGYGGSMDL